MIKPNSEDDIATPILVIELPAFGFSLAKVSEEIFTLSNIE